MIWIFFGIVLLAAIAVYSYKENSKESTKNDSFSDTLIINLDKKSSDVIATAPITQSNKPDSSSYQKSLDSTFAKQHDLWECAFCETLNYSIKSKCVACGKKR